MVNGLTCTYDGKLIAINYFLYVYINHGSSNETDSANCVVFAIIILQPPMEPQVVTGVPVT